MQNIALIFSAIIVAMLSNACGMAQDSIDSHLDSHSNANLKDIDRELIYAAMGDLQEVKRLISQGANVNADMCVVSYNLCGSSTPLMMAVVNGYLEMVKFLVENGADINYRNFYGDSALDFALTEYRDDSKEIAQFLIQNGADLSDVSLFDTIDGHDRVYTEMMEILLENGVDIDYRNKKGKSILLYFAELRWLEHIDFLIKNGANVNLQDDKGNTALALIARRLAQDLDEIVVNVEEYPISEWEVIKIMKSLIKHGADATLKDEFGKNALDYLNDELYRAIFGKNRAKK